MKTTTIALAMTALIAVTPPAVSQSRQESQKVRLVLQDSMSAKGVSAVIRQNGGDRGQALIVFRRREFTPALLGMSLTMLASDAAELSDSRKEKLEAIIPSGMALPLLEGEWGLQMTALANELQSSPSASIPNLARGRSLVVDIPQPMPCDKCPKSTQRDKPEK